MSECCDSGATHNTRVRGATTHTVVSHTHSHTTHPVRSPLHTQFTHRRRSLKLRNIALTHLVHTQTLQEYRTHAVTTLIHGGTDAGHMACGQQPATQTTSAQAHNRKNMPPTITKQKVLYQCASLNTTHAAWVSNIGAHLPAAVQEYFVFIQLTIRFPLILIFHSLVV